MIRKYRIGILGGAAALVAAALAYVGTRLSYAGLAAEFVALATLVVHRQSKILGRVEVGLRRQARTDKRLDDLSRESKRDHDRTAKKLVAFHKDIDHRMDVVADRSDKQQAQVLRGEIRLLAATIRDQEIESGLAALNRYASLASGQDMAPESGVSDPIT